MYMYKYMIDKLPDDMINLIHEFVDPETTWIQTKVKDLNVNDSGWIIANNALHTRIKHKRSLLNIKRAMEEIPLLFIPAKTVTQSSYAMKHDVSDYRKLMKVPYDKYISNGEFICAMILLGFKFATPTCLNVHFKVKNIPKKRRKSINYI